MANNHSQPTVVGTTGSPLELTAEQQTRLATVKEMGATVFADDEGNANAAYTAAHRYLNTSPSERTATIDALAEDIRQARDEAATVLAMARGTVIVAAADGWSENGLANKLGLDRMTIRKWLGKRD